MDLKVAEWQELTAVQIVKPWTPLAPSDIELGRALFTVTHPAGNLSPSVPGSLVPSARIHGLLSSRIGVGGGCGAKPAKQLALPPLT